LHIVHSKSDVFRKAWSAISTRTIEGGETIEGDSKGGSKGGSKGDKKGDKGNKRMAEEEVGIGNKKTKAKPDKSVHEILLGKAMKLKQKWLTTCGQAAAFTGAVSSDPQFAWISDANMEPIKAAKDKLDQDRHLTYVPHGVIMGSC
jgi:hypothetical protein